MFDGCDRETPMEALKRVTAERDSLAEQLFKARDARRPVVGAAVLVFNDEGRVLLSQRTHGKCQDWFAAPGGHVEWGESFLQAAVREAKEEAGLDIYDADLLGVFNCHMPEEDHHFIVAIFKTSEWIGSIKDLDGEWGWYDINMLPVRTLPAIRQALEKMKGSNPVPPAVAALAPRQPSAPAGKGDANG